MHIKKSDYPEKADDVMLAASADMDAEADATLTEGYILRNTVDKYSRQRPVERNYISPVPSGQIQLYESKGYHLTQTKEWQ